MPINERSEFGNFVERIFQETYGFPSRALFFAEKYEERNKIREAVVALRLSYEEDFCTTPYGEKEIRDAYMISYYPYYYLPAYNIMAQHVIPTLKASGFKPNNSPLNVMYLAGGPCPELFGTALAVSESNFCKEIRGHIFDVEQGWEEGEQITFKLCKDFAGVDTNVSLHTAYNVFDLDCSEITPSPDSYDCWSCSDKYDCEKYFGALLFDEINVLFMQNYLSHVTDVEEFLKYLKGLASSAHHRMVFVFSDLKYVATSQIFDIICDENFLKETGLKLIAKRLPSEAIPLDHKNLPTDDLRLNVLDGSPNEFHNTEASFGIITNVFNKRIDEREDTKDFLTYLNSSERFIKYMEGTGIFKAYKNSNSKMPFVKYVENEKGKSITEYLKNPKRNTRFCYVVLQENW